MSVPQRIYSTAGLALCRRSETAPRTDQDNAVGTSSVADGMDSRPTTNNQPAVEWVQALADILRSALYAFAVYRSISLHMCVCCHSNETRAPIANPPNSAQLEGTPLLPSKLHPGPCSSVGMWRETDRETDRHTDGCGQYMPHTKCNKPAWSNICRIFPGTTTWHYQQHWHFVLAQQFLTFVPIQTHKRLPTMSLNCIHSSSSALSATVPVSLGSPVLPWFYSSFLHMFRNRTAVDKWHRFFMGWMPSLPVTQPTGSEGFYLLWIFQLLVENSIQ